MQFTVVNFVLLILILLSIYVWGVGLWKIWQLRGIKKSTVEFEVSFWEAKIFLRAKKFQKKTIV